MAKPRSNRQNRQYDEEDDDFTTCNWLEYTLVVVLGCLLLLAALVLVLFWTLYFQQGYAWSDNPDKQFNAHPTLMIAGFITLTGFSILLYRISRCCRHIYVKLFHTVFHALAIPCIALGFIAVFYSKALSSVPTPHFYSMHSWMGLFTMGLFAAQFVFGFFSFLVLLCCEGSTAACRAAFVPIHASFGLIVFMMAIATCLTGLTEKTLFTLKENYTRLPEEAIIVNVLAMVLVALGVLISYILHRDSFRTNNGNIITERL